jgi:hypothetical protein
LFVFNRCRSEGSEPARRTRRFRANNREPLRARQYQAEKLWAAQHNVQFGGLAQFLSPPDKAPFFCDFILRQFIGFSGSEIASRTDNYGHYETLRRAKYSLNCALNHCEARFYFTFTKNFLF